MITQAQIDDYGYGYGHEGDPEDFEGGGGGGVDFRGRAKRPGRSFTRTGYYPPATDISHPAYLGRGVDIAGFHAERELAPLDEPRILLERERVERKIKGRPLGESLGEFETLPPGFQPRQPRRNHYTFARMIPGMPGSIDYTTIDAPDKRTAEEIMLEMGAAHGWDVGDLRRVEGRGQTVERYPAFIGDDYMLRDRPEPEPERYWQIITPHYGDYYMAGTYADALSSAGIERDMAKIKELTQWEWERL